MKTAKYLFILITLSFFCQTALSQSSRKMYGITIDGINNLNNICTAIGSHRYRVTTRIVFDEWIPASDYTLAVNRIDSISVIMGELLDSYYVKDYSIAQYKARTDEYMNTLGSKVDIWEVGNEVNGEWLGPTDSVLAKINYAYQKCESMQYRSALTLYYNKNCWERPQNEMFRWVNQNLSMSIRNGIDYLFVSYYEDDCNNLQPNWQQVFDSLHVLFPNSRLGIGECGTTIASKKEEYINRYYKMQITTPNYIGGYFWWYYRQDCVPWTSKPMWGVLDYAIRASALFDGQDVLDGDGY